MPNPFVMQTVRSQSGEESQRDTISSKTLAIMIVATSLGFLLVQMDVSIVNVALARIGTDLRTTIAGLQWVVDAYTLLFASLLLFAGTFADLTHR